MQNQSKLNRSWTKEEDDKLRRQINGTVKPNWEAVAKESGLKRSANSCRLRWINQLKPGYRPDCKLTDEEKLLILEFRYQYGRNRWAKIAKHLLAGRRDNDVKNYWHSLAKKAKREGRDVDGDAFRKRAELVEAIRAAGKFTMDYSSSIRADAFEKLKELFPDLAAAGGGAVAEVAASSSFTGAVSLASDLGISNDLASSSAATDIGTADAVTSCYSVEFGPGQVDYGDVSKIEPTAEIDQVILQEQFLEALGINFSSTPTEISNPGQLHNSGLVDDGGGPTAAFQMQGSEYSTPAGQLGIINSEDLYLGGGPAEFNQATVAAFHSIGKSDFY